MKTETPRTEAAKFQVATGGQDPYYWAVYAHKMEDMELELIAARDVLNDISKYTFEDHRCITKPTQEAEMARDFLQKYPE
jgi:hypothetical protein